MAAYPGGDNHWWFADQQNGPECGFEAVENTIQQFWPVSNSVSDTILKQLARNYGALMPDGSLHPAGYRALLQHYQIQSAWYAFDHSLLINALHQRRIVVAIVDASHIDINYPSNSGHALMLTRVVRDDANRFVIGYQGVDSNYSGQGRWWDAHAFQRAAAYYAPNSLLITQPLRRVR